jgi:glycosyltransferase involved in cell wall biosynthesis
MQFISVIIPLYNKENFITETIQSVLNQSYTDFEIVIVNDCSTDGSRAKVTDFESSKIRLIDHQINQGLSASRNTGIKNAKAEYLAFLDADDCWKPNFLDKIIALIGQFPQAGLFATNYDEVYDNQLVLKPKNQILNWKSDGIIADFFEVSLSQLVYCHSSLCVRKTVFETVGYYAENIDFGEDIDFLIRANLKFKTAYSNEHLALFKVFTENQITQSSLKNKRITDFKYYEKQFPTNISLIKYLNFNRYIMAKLYKMEADFVNFERLKSEINFNIKPSGINTKQCFLLHLPLFVLKFVKKVKNFLLKKGFRITTYS